MSTANKRTKNPAKTKNNKISILRHYFAAVNVLHYHPNKNSLNQAKSTLNRVLRYGMLLDFFISVCQPIFLLFYTLIFSLFCLYIIVRTHKKQELFTMQYYEGLNYKHLYPADQAQYNREFTLYHIKKDYKEVGLKAFESVTEIGENFQCGKSDNYYFVIKPNGNLINRAFNYVGKFREGNCVVMYEQPCRKHPYFEHCGNHLDTDGQLVFGHHQFVYIGNFVNGMANVILPGGTKNYIDKQGNILFPQFSDLTNTFEFSCGWGCIQREYKEYNYINAEGKLLLTEWADRAWDFVDNKARVIINGTEQFIEINT